MSIFEKYSNFPCLSWLALKYLLPLVTALIFMPHILSISISDIWVDMILSRLTCMSMRWEGFPLLFFIAKLLILVFLRAPIIRMRVITTTNQTPLRITRSPNWEHKKFNNIQMAEYWFFFLIPRAKTFPIVQPPKFSLEEVQTAFSGKNTFLFPFVSLIQQQLWTAKKFCSSLVYLSRRVQPIFYQATKAKTLQKS